MTTERDLIQRLAHELYKYECLISLCPPDYIPAPSPLVAEAHAVIAADRARWGCPAVEPVPVSERLPGPKDCWPDGHEKVGCCWLWTPVDGLGRWEVQHRDWASEPGESYTHWLPYYAMPVRTPTETNGQA